MSFEGLGGHGSSCFLGFGQTFPRPVVAFWVPKGCSYKVLGRNRGHVCVIFVGLSLNVLWFALAAWRRMAVGRAFVVFSRVGIYVAGMQKVVIPDLQDELDGAVIVRCNGWGERDVEVRCDKQECC